MRLGDERPVYVIPQSLHLGAESYGLKHVNQHNRVVMFDPEAVRSRIEEVALAEAELSAGEARDVAFHMTDWIDDLSTLVRFYQEPTALSSAQVNKLLIDFLVHAPNHLAAASKLFVDMPVTDVFSVGAVERSGRSAG